MGTLPIHSASLKIFWKLVWSPVWWLLVQGPVHLHLPHHDRLLAGGVHPQRGYPAPRTLRLCSGLLIWLFIPRHFRARGLHQETQPGNSAIDASMRLHHGLRNGNPQLTPPWESAIDAAMGLHQGIPPWDSAPFMLYCLSGFEPVPPQPLAWATYITSIL